MTPRASGAQELGGSGVDELRPASAWLVLGLVLEQPSHGYELSQRYQRRFGDLLPLSVPRVYGALDRLRDAGLIEAAGLKSAEPPRKQHQMRRSYRATREGTEEYQRWVAERMRDDPLRPQLLSRITATGLLGIDAVLEVIDQYQRQCMEELRTLAVPGEPANPAGSSLEELTDALITDQRRRELRARNDWAVHARELLQAHKKASATREHDASEKAGAAKAGEL